jgi:hypothetical protein
MSYSELDHRIETINIKRSSLGWNSHTHICHTPHITHTHTHTPIKINLKFRLLLGNKALVLKFGSECLLNIYCVRGLGPILVELLRGGV